MHDKNGKPGVSENTVIATLYEDFADERVSHQDEESEAVSVRWGKADWERARNSIDEIADAVAQSWPDLSPNGKKRAIKLFMDSFNVKMLNAKFPLASIYQGYTATINESGRKEREKTTLVRSYYGGEAGQFFSCNGAVWVEVFTGQLRKYSDYAPTKDRVKGGFWRYFTTELRFRRKDKPIPHWFIKRDTSQSDETTRGHLRALAKIVAYCRENEVSYENVFSFLASLPDKYEKLKELTGFKDTQLLDYFIECYNPTRAESLDNKGEDGKTPEITDPSGIDIGDEILKMCFDKHPHKEMVGKFTLAVRQHKDKPINHKDVALITRAATKEMVDYEACFYVDNYTDAVTAIKSQRKRFHDHDLDSVTQVPRSASETNHESNQLKYRPKNVYGPDIADWCNAENIFHPTLCCEIFAQGEILGEYPLRNTAQRWGLETGSIRKTDANFINIVLKSVYDQIADEALASNKKAPMKEGR